MKGDTWTIVETARTRKMRQRTLHLITVKGGKDGNRSDLRSSLCLDDGARMHHLRGARNSGGHSPEMFWLRGVAPLAYIDSRTHRAKFFRIMCTFGSPGKSKHERV